MSSGASKSNRNCQFNVMCVVVGVYAHPPGWFDAQARAVTGQVDGQCVTDRIRNFYCRLSTWIITANKQPLVKQRWKGQQRSVFLLATLFGRPYFWRGFPKDWLSADKQSEFVLHYNPSCGIWKREFEFDKSTFPLFGVAANLIVIWLVILDKNLSLSGVFELIPR